MRHPFPYKKNQNLFTLLQSKTGLFYFIWPFVDIIYAATILSQGLFALDFLDVWKKKANLMVDEFKFI